MDRNLSELKASIEAITDPADKQIGRAMAILVCSLEVGPDVERLSEHTGFSTETIRNIADRMIEAGLWIEELVDDSEWWDEQGDLDGLSLFAHAQVAVGAVLRKTRPECILYIDRETGKVLLRRERTVH